MAQSQCLLSAVHNNLVLTIGSQNLRRLLQYKFALSTVTLGQGEREYLQEACQARIHLDSYLFIAVVEVTKVFSIGQTLQSQ